jgi:excisionase family DNA binding protein
LFAHLGAIERSKHLKKSKPQPDPIFVSTAETARLLGVSRWLVYQLIGEKKVESVKQGRRTYVSYPSLKSYAAGLKAPTGYLPRTSEEEEASHG